MQARGERREPDRANEQHNSEMPQRLAAEGRSHGRRQDSDDQAGGQGAKGVNMDTMRDGSEEDTISGSSNTGSSYTSSSYCGSTDSDDSGSDDTFYVPEVTFAVTLIAG